MADTNIEWTDRVWNPVTGCTKVSQGCRHCYAETVANRFWHHQYVHTAARGFIPVKAYSADALTGTPRQFTDVMTHEDRLREPLKWKKPQRVFVNSMSDLFHEDVPDAFIDQVFAVMALAPQHTFQVLTKRPERMLAFFADVPFRQEMIGIEAERLSGLSRYNDTAAPRWPIPLAHVWMGVSVEDQQTADERIPLLLQTPASVRFVSAEPLLRTVDLEGWIGRHAFGDTNNVSGGLDWVIVGGESGPGARPCDVAWVRSIVQQCQAAAVPVFVKQLGARPFDGSIDRASVDYSTHAVGAINGVVYLRHIESRKGADPSEWPEDLRVRQMPFRESAQ